MWTAVPFLLLAAAAYWSLGRYPDFTAAAAPARAQAAARA